jgi:hypothetical protein
MPPEFAALPHYYFAQNFTRNIRRARSSLAALPPAARPHARRAFSQPRLIALLHASVERPTLAVYSLVISINSLVTLAQFSRAPPLPRLGHGPQM